MDNQPQDFISQQAAFPTEQAEIRNDPFTGANHAELPGMNSLPYLVGNENNLLDGIGQGLPGERDYTGVYSVSNGAFSDQQPAYNIMGFDSQQGIVTGSIPVSLSGDRMYVSPLGNLPVGFHEMANTDPEIAGETTTE